MTVTLADIDPHLVAAANLRRLVALRAIAVLGQALAVWVAVRVLDLALPVAWLVVLISLLALINLGTLWRLRQAWPITDVELLVQLLIDVAALTGLLYLSGGSTNPFVSLYLVPLMLSAAALPARYTWLMAAATIACYSVLMIWHVPLPHAHGAATSDFDLHVIGMWLGFVLSAVLIAYFVVNMGDSLRRRDRALAEARENSLRGERIVALATLASGAAHELGTPLSTLAVLTKDLDREWSSTERKRKLGLMQEQVQRCKDILMRIAASAGAQPAAGGRQQTVDVYLESLLNDWRGLRPAAVLTAVMQSARPGPTIVVDDTLTQALTAVFNNAADASPQDIEINMDWNDERLQVTICDRGTGLSSTALRRAGEAFFTTKPPEYGMGIGLFLAKTAVQRLGGQLELNERTGGGACACLNLPLARLRVEPVS